MNGTSASASRFSDSQYALVIGVDRVASGWQPELRSPSRDARAVADALLDPSGCALAVDRVQLAVNEEATRAAVLERLRELVAHLDNTSNLFIYFAGHGTDDGDDFYLLTCDARSDSPATTCLSGNDLEKALAGSAASGVFVVVDCCEGGAAADCAPSLFRHLPRGGYRILLASSRPGQLSWERADGSGTLFSTALKEVLEGKAQVGDASGAIYFSDLVQQIDYSIGEALALQRGRSAPAQDMVFAGVYTKDPLLFVHRGLSLQSIEFRTARFSPQFVRRRIRQAVAAIVGALAFVAVAVYGMLDATQYASVDGGTLVVRRGHPRFNLPGYPQLVWSLGYGPERLDPDAAVDIPLVGKLGEKLGPHLAALTRPAYRAASLADQGKVSEARTLTLGLLDAERARPEEKLYAMLVFPTVAQAEDRARLRKLLGHERRDVRIAAFAGLLGLAERPEDIVGDVDRLDEGDHQDVVNRLTGRCSAARDAYLQMQFATKSNVPTNADIVDAALRLGCRLSDRSLATATLRPGFVGDGDLANFAVVAGLSETYAARLHDLLSDPKVERWSLATVLGTLARLPNAPCPDGRAAEDAPIALSGLMHRAAIARHCPGVSMVARWDATSRTFVVHSAGGRGDLGDLKLDPAKVDGQLGIRFLLETAAISDPNDIRDAIGELILRARSDDFVRANLIRVATARRIEVAMPADILDSNNLDVRRAVTEYERMRNEAELARQVVQRVGAQDEFYVELAGRAALNDAQLSRIELLLGGGPSERRQAGCVLAMRARPAKVLNLMTSADDVIRSSATGCAVYNVDAPALAEALPLSVGGFDLLGRANFVRQTKARLALQEAMAGLPPALRVWRLTIMDKQSRGPWSEGMRYWIREQRYRSSLAP